MVFDELGACGCQHQQRAIGPSGNVSERGQQLIISPVKVFHEERRWRASCFGGREARPGVRERVGHGDRADSAERVVGHADAGSRCQRKHHVVSVALALSGPAEERLHRYLELAAGGHGRVIKRDAARLAHDLAESPVGDAVAGRATAPTQHAELGHTGRGLLQELAHEAALADPSGPEDEAQGRPAGPDGFIQLVMEHAQLAVAPEEGCLKTARQCPVRRRANEPPCCYRRAPAFDVELIRRIEAE